MLKKRLLILAILTASSSNIFALSFPYIGAGIGWQDSRGYSGVIGNFFGGYGYTLDEQERFYLGGEGFLNFLSLPIQEQLKHRVTWAFGGAFIPGFFISQNALLYGRLGLAVTHWYKPDSTATGAQLGLGLQYSLTRVWDMRAEYAWAGSGFYDGLGSTRSGQINLALVYRFNCLN